MADRYGCAGRFCQSPAFRLVTVGTVPDMVSQGMKRTGPAGRALRLTLWACVIVSVPLYLWFLHHAAGWWAEHLPEDDNVRLWLPYVVPGAALSFTLLAALSWWVSIVDAKPFLLGRTRWRFLVVFVCELSLIAGVLGAQVRDATAVVLTVMVTTIGMTGLWLLPPTLSPRLLAALPKRDEPSADS
jgi:hypothetical protein